jgi:hypothetical protein
MHNISSMYINHREILTGTVPFMPKTNANTDPQIQKAVGYLKSFPNMAVLLMIKLADFQFYAPRASMLCHADVDPFAKRHANIPPFR